MATRVETHDVPSAAQSYNRGPSAAGSREQNQLFTPVDNRLIKGLGWFSIGLGLAELIAPKEVARITGTRNHSWLLRFYGLRELAAGIGILTQARPAPWLWARVGGDAVDLATLGAALSNPDNDRGLTMMATAAVAGVTALDVYCAQKLSDEPPSHRSTMRAEANIIVNKSPEECYRFYRDFENLPRFMKYLESVRITGERTSHWVAKGPGDITASWDAEMTEDIPNERISWQALPGSEVSNAGTVEFEPAPGGRGTIVRVQMELGAPMASAAMLARMIGKHPEQLAEKDIRRFKQVIETGDIITTEGQSAGRASGATWLDEIAR